MARPTKKTAKIVEEICRRLSEGETMRKICSDKHMPHFSNVWRWEQNDEAFRNLTARAREAGTHSIADDCIRIADDPTLDPADKRVRIDTRIRLIGKWNAKKYGDEIKLTGDAENPLKLQVTIVDDVK